MPSSKFAIEAGGEKRLEISWRGLWKDIVVRFDGEDLGGIDGKDELKRGKSFDLPDGSEIHVRLITGFANTELQVQRNGKPLPGSASDPAVRVKAAATVLYFIAGMSGLLGIISVATQSELLQSLGIGWPSAVAGVVYGALGYFTSKRSKLALGLGTGLFILDGLFSLVSVIGEKGTPPTGGIIMRVFLVLALFRGFRAIDDLNRAMPEDDVKKAFD